MATLRVQRDNGSEELTAAQVYDIANSELDAKLLRTVVTNSRTIAVRPEKWFSEIGEIHFGISRGAKIAGYAQINAYEVTKDGRPGKIVTSGEAARIASMFQSPYGGQRGLIERYFTLMKVPGDCYMIRCRERPDLEENQGNVIGYDVIGSSEIIQSSIEGVDIRNGVGSRSIKRRLLPGGSGGGDTETFNYIEPRDFLGRIWRPAISYVQLPDSPMAALDTQCEVLHLLTLGLKGKLLSRLALNGILFVPSEINDVRSGSPQAGEPVLDNKMFDRLIKAASWAIMNFEDPRSALPIFASGPAQFADGIRHIILDREIYQTDMELRAEMIDRILTGLDIQKAQTQGNGDQSHFNLWAGADDEIRVNVRPDLETFMWAATRLVLNRELQEAGKTPATQNKYMLWFDLSSANSNVNLAEDARQANDRLLINSEAARRAMGFDEADAPTGDEQVRAVGLKVNNPYLALWGTDEWKKIDWELVAGVGSVKAGPNEQTPATTPESNPGNVPGKRGQRQESDTPRRLKPAN